MIQVEHITKRYGDKVAVDDLSFEVRPGVVTGFLGPNGAGKSTTMRVILGLDRPSTGRALIEGVEYQTLRAPLHKVGALLEARAIHTGRSAYHHLLAMAQTHGIPATRVEKVLDLVGLKDVGRRRAGGFSLGMGQRLGVASALLGDPDVLILDEPANGLDPEGIVWIRNLLKGLAAEGRTVFLSSHMISEIAQTAEHLIIVGRGRLLADTSTAELVAQASTDAEVLVRTPEPTRLAELLVEDGATVTSRARGVLEVTGRSSEQIGELAAEQGLVLHELTPQRVSLENVFMRLTGETVEYHATTPASAPADPMELAA